LAQNTTPVERYNSPARQLRDVTCRMESHSVTCHPTQVNAPRLNPNYGQLRCWRTFIMTSSTCRQCA